MDLRCVDDGLHGEAEQIGRLGHEHREPQRISLLLDIDEQIDVRGVVIRAACDGSEDSDVLDAATRAERDELITMCGQGQ